MTGPLLRALRQLISADRLHGILEFEADPLVLENKFPSFRCGCKEAPSSDGSSTAKHIQVIHKRGQAARLPRVWGC